MLKSTKKRVSNRSKKTWRKNIDTKEYDNFLEEKLRDERVGSLDDKKDEELFIIDTKPIAPPTLTRNEFWAQKRLKCFQILESSSAVPDPISKRNRVKTKEERKHPLKKKLEETRKAKGIVPKRILEANQQRELTIRKKKLKPKGFVIKEDVWDKKEDGEISRNKWLTTDTIRHNLTNTRSLKVKTPASILKKKSVLPPIENPHPGMSYNPSFSDHQDLLEKVIEKEMVVQKEEAHIKRVTTQAFSKVTPAEKENTWIVEMSQGLIKTKEEEEEEKFIDNEYKAINPPSNFEKKKTLKQRRKQREQKQEKLLRKHQKMEKKKVADIYKLKFLGKQIQKTEEKQLVSRENKEKAVEKWKLGTKRLGRHKFSEPDLEFTRGAELRGNLRATQPQGSLLQDRFYSLQKRNILAPSIRVTKFKKAKVKRFVKASHKMEEPLLVKKKKK